MTAELFNAEVVEVGKTVGEQVQAATGSAEETQGIQALVETFVASNALDLGMSPKEFWQKYGATILGEPDVQRNSKGALTEVQGKEPGQWKSDAFSQSWGKFERFKSVILETPNSFKGSYRDLSRLLKGLRGKDLKLGNSETATLSSKGINEIVSRPDKDRTVSDEVFKLAVSNLEWLLANSIYGWSAPDRKHRPDIDHYEKHFSGFISKGKAYGVRITVRVVSEKQGGKKAYEVDAFEVNSIESGLDWLQKSYDKESPEKTENSSTAETVEEGTSGLPEGLPQDGFTLTPMNPEVQGLIEALYHLGHGSFSQASKGDFYPDLKLIARWKGADRSTLLHETGHMFLEARMQSYSELLKNGGPQAAGQRHFTENMQSVLKFLGVKNIEQWQAMSMDQRRKGHEKFARSFEAWLMLGKALSENLQGVFAQFASWLKKLYICLKNIPGAQFDDSVQ